MASVLPRVLRDGTVRWRVQFRINGSPQQKTFTEKDGADQFGALIDKIGPRAALEVLNARNSRRASTPTLREWVIKYLDSASGLLTGITDGTREGYRRVAERSFLQVLGEYPVDAIGKADVGRWVAWQEKQPSLARKGQMVAPKTIRNYHALLSSSLAAAVSEGLRGDNPAHRTKLSKGRRSESVFLTSEEFATLLHFIPQHYESFVLFLAGTGCRWGEATAVTWGDLDLRAVPATVRIDKAWKKGATGAPVLGNPKSERANRTISIPPDLVAALGDPGPSNELVFPGRLSGGHLWYHRFRTTTWLPAVERARNAEECEREGLDPLTKSPTIHDLRHSHASWLLADGAPLSYVQARLGHESINTTVNVYGHLQPDAPAQMAALIAGRLAGVRPLRQLRA